MYVNCTFIILQTEPILLLLALYGVVILSN